MYSKVASFSQSVRNDFSSLARNQGTLARVVHGPKVPIPHVQSQHGA